MLNCMTATSACVSLEEYLGTAYEHDPDYVDGELVERSLPTLLHGETFGRVHLRLAGLRYPLHLRTELRMPVKPRRYRVADLAVFLGERPKGKYPSTPPLIVVEILSDDDRLSEALEKAEDYYRWGVRHVWLADPDRRALFVFDGSGLRQVPDWALLECETSITPEQVFPDQTD